MTNAKNLTTHEVKSIVLHNSFGMSVEIINYGARIKSIKFPVNGQPTEMVVGYDDAENYINEPFYLGATCGRVCNRISKGKFTLNNIDYQLPINSDENCLHGGIDNFSMRYWQINEQQLSDSSVCLHLVSEDGDQGFPGEVSASVIYELTDDNKLKIHYNANTTKATPINLTNHAYFHLGEASCQTLLLQINASAYLQRNENAMPTGDFLSVANTDFDFRSSQAIGPRQLASNNQELKSLNCYDHCYVLDSTAIQETKAELISKQNNVRMRLYTDQPSLQLYSAYYLTKPFYPYQGVCLEAQNYTDAVNISHFPNCVLQPNEQYKKNIIYAFENTQ
ncbi:aldose epimerase family protein [Thalassotalea profundi]|uniref:Aldose 1-epimerase n=1 Tax=Thalassotalea profundi TaxID=2036687 RepID=A0ABQ3IQN2_9GAMM|nr:aldose epimerase family protein [Thalassotalea profundi]GHE88954.1 aldose 1-epimerase [Thalassotalea profundi]